MGHSRSLYCAGRRPYTGHCCVWRHPSISDRGFRRCNALKTLSKQSTFDDFRTHNFLGVFRVRGINKSLKRVVREKWVIHNERFCYKSFVCITVDTHFHPPPHMAPDECTHHHRPDKNLFITFGKTTPGFFLMRSSRGLSIHTFHLVSGVDFFIERSSCLYSSSDLRA